MSFFAHKANGVTTDDPERREKEIAESEFERALREYFEQLQQEVIRHVHVTA